VYLGLTLTDVQIKAENPSGVRRRARLIANAIAYAHLL